MNQEAIKYEVNYSSFIVTDRPASLLCVNEKYMVLPSGTEKGTANLLEVWEWEVETQERHKQLKRTNLDGGFKNITAMALGRASEGSPLCVASRERIIIWDSLDKAINPDDEDEEIAHELDIDLNNTPVTQIVFEPENHKMLSVAIGYWVYVFELNSYTAIMKLEGHQSQITGSAFIPEGRSNRLITISEDRTFKIWNLDEQNCTYQSSIISSSPFVSVCCCIRDYSVGESSSVASKFVLATADGKIRFFELDQECRCIQTIDLGAQVKKLVDGRKTIPEVSTTLKVVSSLPPWKQQTSDSPQELTADEEVSISFNILGMLYAQLGKKQRLSKGSRIHTDGTETFLLVGTADGLIQINTATYEIIPLVMFKDFQNSDSLSPRHRDNLVQIARAYAFEFSGQMVSIVIGGAFRPIVNILEYSPILKEDIVQNMLSIFPNSGPPNGSPLNQTLVRKIPEPKKDTKWKPNLTKTTGVVVTKPVTFHTKIKSSGYGSMPPFGKSPSTSKTKTTAKSSKAPVAPPKRYPNHTDVTQYYQPKHQLQHPLHNGAITKVNFIGDGSKILTCAMDKTARVTKHPIGKYRGEGIALLGHNAPLNYVHSSSDAAYAITCSEDSTARIYEISSGDLLLQIDKMESNLLKKDQAPASLVNNPSFIGGLKHARFYYQDKFFFITSKNTLYMYKYHIDKEEHKKKQNDLKNLQNNNRYKLVTKFSVNGQTISSLNCINTFKSNLVFCGGSNKSVEIYDIAHERGVRSMVDAHTRAVHTIHLLENSQYISHSKEMHDLFLTSAADSSIKLWDLRTDKCVKLFSGHTNRVQEIGVSLSTCMRYIATGSEDKCAYIFDIRTGSYLKKLQGHTDVVSDVSYHPLFPQLVTSSFDGHLRFFNDKE